jgi:hypothetical protein
MERREYDYRGESDFDYEAKCLVERSMSSGKEFQFIEYLMQTPFSRCDKKLDKLCRDFLTLIKNKYKDVLMENLLEEEQQQTKQKWTGVRN